MKQNEPDTPFDTIFFWLGLATIDYSFLFEEAPETDKDAIQKNLIPNYFPALKRSN